MKGLALGFRVFKEPSALLPFSLKAGRPYPLMKGLRLGFMVLKKPSALLPFSLKGGRPYPLLKGLGFKYTSIQLNRDYAEITTDLPTSSR